VSREQRTLADYADETATAGGFVRASELHDPDTDDDDDGEESGDSAVFGTCEDCGEQQPGVWVRDPYPVPLCRACWKAREGLA